MIIYIKTKKYISKKKIFCSKTSKAYYLQMYYTKQNNYNNNNNNNEQKKKIFYNNFQTRIYLNEEREREQYGKQKKIRKLIIKNECIIII